MKWRRSDPIQLNSIWLNSESEFRPSIWPLFIDWLFLESGRSWIELVSLSIVDIKRTAEENWGVPPGPLAGRVATPPTPCQKRRQLSATRDRFMPPSWKRSKQKIEGGKCKTNIPRVSGIGWNWRIEEFISIFELNHSIIPGPDAFNHPSDELITSLSILRFWSHCGRRRRRWEEEGGGGREGGEVEIENPEPRRGISILPANDWDAHETANLYIDHHYYYHLLLEIFEFPAEVIGISNEIFLISGSWRWQNAG